VRTPDRQFREAFLADLYDRQHPPAERGDYAFYLKLAMSAESVLDVGCGTGSFLGLVRDAGHTGRLCGLDPAEGMLGVARRRDDVEWVLGDPATVSWDREFSLIVMAGHAFQVFVTDDEIRAALASIRASLADDGRFAFETRNPAARAWENWTPERAASFVDASGVVVRYEVRLDEPVVGDVVNFTSTYVSNDWRKSESSHSTLRFVTATTLADLLAESGLAIEARHGDWNGEPLTDSSPEIITIARRS
jgi:SAM-dependent methyltransferase